MDEHRGPGWCGAFAPNRRYWPVNAFTSSNTRSLIAPMAPLRSANNSPCMLGDSKGISGRYRIAALWRPEDERGDYVERAARSAG